MLATSLVDQVHRYTGVWAGLSECNKYTAALVFGCASQCVVQSAGQAKAWTHAPGRGLTPGDRAEGSKHELNRAATALAAAWRHLYTKKKRSNQETVLFQKIVVQQQRKIVGIFLSGWLETGGYGGLARSLPCAAAVMI